MRKVVERAQTIKELRKAFKKALDPSQITPWYDLTIMEHFNNAQTKDEQKKKQKAI